MAMSLRRQGGTRRSDCGGCVPAPSSPPAMGTRWRPRPSPPPPLHPHWRLWGTAGGLMWVPILLGLSQVRQGTECPLPYCIPWDKGFSVPGRNGSPSQCSPERAGGHIWHQHPIPCPVPRGELSPMGAVAVGRAQVMQQPPMTPPGQMPTLQSSCSCSRGPSVAQGKWYGVRSYLHLFYEDCAGVSPDGDTDESSPSHPYGVWPSIIWKVRDPPLPIFSSLSSCVKYSGTPIPAMQADPLPIPVPR